VATARSAHVSRSALARISRSRMLRKYLGRPYLHLNIWIWNQLPRSLATWGPVHAFGVHLHHLIQLRETRIQSVGTFFLRNRPELELLVRLLDRVNQGSTLSLVVLGCSKGAEVYSISYAIRSVRPNLEVKLQALDISKEIVEFAEAGAYSLGYDGSDDLDSSHLVQDESVARNTLRDQPSSVFERMTAAERAALFDSAGNQVQVKPQFRDGIGWHVGDAADPGLVGALGLHDIVVANRFLCHMNPEQATACLRNLARLVRSGGYLFVSGVDLDVRSKVAQELGWRPVTENIREIHDGDISLRHDWPLRYWGLEPFDQTRSDWETRYAAVFQIPERSETR
jgi:chemotaxis methyl-accepting protein methylase